VKILKNGFFIERKSMKPIAFGYQMTGRIPKMMANDRASQALAS
jgi:hypothetical protein